MRTIKTKELIEKGIQQALTTWAKNRVRHDPDRDARRGLKHERA